MLHQLLENVLQTVDHFEISCLGAPFSWLKSPEIAWGEIWTVWRMFQWGSTDPLFPSRTQNSIQISPHVVFGAFPIMKRELRGKKFQSDQRSAARFREVGEAL
jgi:hypothetical protein